MGVSKQERPTGSRSEAKAWRGSLCAGGVGVRVGSRVGPSVCGVVSSFDQRSTWLGETTAASGHSRRLCAPAGDASLSTNAR
jgi:hypothetical protein